MKPVKPFSTMSPSHKHAVMKECDELDVAWSRGSLVLAVHEIKKHKIITTDHNYECTGCRGQLILCRLKHKRFIKSACFRHKSYTASCKGGCPETAEHYKCKYYNIKKIIKK